MINKYENMHIEINIERAFFLNIIKKSQQEHPLFLPILFVLYVRKKAIFLHNLVC